MLTLCPKHKGTEKLQKEIKERIRRLKYKGEKEKKQKKSGFSLTIKKEGAAQIVIIGLPNSGKSTLLAELSGSKVEIAEYAFTTKEPVVKMIPYENIKLQTIEIPAIYEGFYDSSKGPSLLSLVRQADLVIVLVDKDKAKNELKIIKDELDKASIELGVQNKGRRGFVDTLPSLVIYVAHNKTLEFPAKDLIKKSIWKSLKKIRVQTRTKGKVADKPVILKQGATVEELAKIIHKDFVKKFKYAKIWGKSAKFEGQQVGLNHILKDKDVVEIYTK
jgi:small GTP-binding protein